MTADPACATARNIKNDDPARERLISSGNGVTVADAVRLESNARFNDGSRVKEITLGSRDATILLNQ